jgi:hypothetical protein
MTDVNIVDDTLYVRLNWLEAIFAFRREFRIPLRHVAAVDAAPDALSGWWKGVRAPGTHVPGLIVAGTYYKDKQQLFWYVRRGDEAVSITLTDAEEYDRLIIGVEDAGEVLNAVRQS